MKIQKGSILKYLNFQTFQYPLGFSDDLTDHIMELVNECFLTRNFINVDTPFRTDSTYEKKLMDALSFTGNSIHKL